jgi:hypothetical protein
LLTVAVNTLAEAPAFAALEVLELHRNRLTPRGATLLRDRFGTAVELRLDEEL